MVPVPQDKELHRKCVLIASEMVKGSDPAYKATFDLCVNRFVVAQIYFCDCAVPI